MKEQLGTLKERAVQWEESAKVAARQEAVELQEKERNLLNKLNNFGSSSREDVMKVSMLLEEVVEEFEGEMYEHQAGLVANNRGHDEHWTDSLKAWNQAVGSDTDEEEDIENNNTDMENNANVGNENKRPGFIVLGMHRSGTSMLSGLLVEGFGYETGGPLIMPSFDNEKVRFTFIYLLSLWQYRTCL